MNEDQPKPQKPAFRCIVDAGLLLRAHLCVGQEETRFHLTGVNIEPLAEGGAVLVATDGHKLVAIRDKDAFVEGGSGIVRLNKRFIADVSSAIRTLNHNYKIVVTSDRAGLITTPAPEMTEDRAVACFAALAELNEKIQLVQFKDKPIIDGTYLSWRGLLDAKPDPSLPIDELCHHHLRRLSRALCGDAQARAIKIVSTGKHAPHLVRAGQIDVEAFGLIMPMRAGIPCDYPDWVKPRESAKAAAPNVAARARWTRFLGLPIRLDPSQPAA
jgi:hypothetical protein